VKDVLRQNINGEQCAIVTYQNLVKLTMTKDPVTYNIVLQILQDEVEHEEDLQAELEDLEIILDSSVKS
jgi:bacterioferritin